MGECIYKGSHCQGLIFKICKQLIQLYNNRKQSKQKWAEVLNRSMFKDFPDGQQELGNMFNSRNY